MKAVETMVNEYDRVKIIATGETGVVVDIRNTNDCYLIVELDGGNELFDCTVDEVEKLQR